jgi:hypothetical protein
LRKESINPYKKIPVLDLGRKLAQVAKVDLVGEMDPVLGETPGKWEPDERSPVDSGVKLHFDERIKHFTSLEINFCERANRPKNEIEVTTDGILEKVERMTKENGELKERNRLLSERCESLSIANKSRCNSSVSVPSKTRSILKKTSRSQTPEQSPLMRTETSMGQNGFFPGGQKFLFNQNSQKPQPQKQERKSVSFLNRGVYGDKENISPNIPPAQVLPLQNPKKKITKTPEPVEQPKQKAH